MIYVAWSLRILAERKRKTVHAVDTSGYGTACGLRVYGDGTWRVERAEASEVTCRTCAKRSWKNSGDK